MGAEPLIRPAGRLYEEDFVEWADQTARLLRSGRFDQIDVAHLVEELEGLANRDRRELGSRLRVLILHLLKWKYQPGRRSGSWRSTINTQRREIAGLLKQSPSLRRALSESGAEAYGEAMEDAASETGLPEDTFPAECPFSEAQILDRVFFP